MTRGTPAVLATFLVLSISSLAKAAKFPKETFRSGGQERVYYLAAPPKLDPGKLVPLLVVLHGSDRNGLSLVEKWQKLAEKEGFVVAGPDQGFAVELVEMPHHDHWYYDLAPKINETAWAFLASRSLPEDPVYEERELR